VTMDHRLQRRVQRYGWDLAADAYEPLWQPLLAAVQAELLACAAPAADERVLDVACGTGLVSFPAAELVGPDGEVLGVDLSAAMVDKARARAARSNATNVRFERMDAERLLLPDGEFDLGLCALGLMYTPDPERALRELQRAAKPGGRIGIAVWGERSRCGWSSLFPIVADEVKSEVCPLFFRLGQRDTLSQLCRKLGWSAVHEQRITTTLDHASAQEACDAAFVGGPVALAWSRLGDATRAHVRAKYLRSIEPWRSGPRFRIPAEFVIVTATLPLETDGRTPALASVRPTM
jgi:ubiquinone/menaquinone biosynthesis C-methylase UbiE